MILTLTPNPTIDRTIFVRGFRLGTIVRGERETVVPSGKGVDASLVIHELGGETVALGLKAGFTGDWHARLLDEQTIAHDLIAAQGETRTAIVLVDVAARDQSTISTSTLSATPEHLSRLLALLDRYAGRAWGLICAGSLPPGLPSDSYAHILRRARQLGLTTLLDSSGESLRRGVTGLPHVLKVNQVELQALDPAMPGIDMPSIEEGREKIEQEQIAADLKALAKRLTGRLGQWASDALIVTLGRHGALAVTTVGSCHAQPPQVPVVSTAGAGDALSGGIMLARSQGDGWPAALALGTAAAASVLMNETTAVCHREQVKKLLPHVNVESL
jgi:1-phosphofructokinase family hexose kinase